jgi:hypothetical protein
MSEYSYQLDALIHAVNRMAEAAGRAADALERFTEQYQQPERQPQHKCMCEVRLR